MSEARGIKRKTEDGEDGPSKKHKTTIQKQGLATNKKEGFQKNKIQPTLTSNDEHEECLKYENTYYYSRERLVKVLTSLAIFLEDNKNKQAQEFLNDYNFQELKELNEHFFSVNNLLMKIPDDKCIEKDLISKENYEQFQDLNKIKNFFLITPTYSKIKLRKTAIKDYFSSYQWCPTKLIENTTNIYQQNDPEQTTEPEPLNVEYIVSEFGFCTDDVQKDNDPMLDELFQLLFSGNFEDAYKKMDNIDNKDDLFDIFTFMQKKLSSLEDTLSKLSEMIGLIVMPSLGEATTFVQHLTTNDFFQLKSEDRIRDIIDQLLFEWQEVVFKWFNFSIVPPNEITEFKVLLCYFLVVEAHLGQMTLALNLSKTFEEKTQIVSGTRENLTILKDINQENMDQFKKQLCFDFEEERKVVVTNWSLVFTPSSNVILRTLQCDDEKEIDLLKVALAKLYFLDVVPVAAGAAAVAVAPLPPVQPLQPTVASVKQYVPYPNIKNADFYSKIHQKKEFRVEGAAAEAPTMEKMCSPQKFDISPQQQWVANYFSTQTPYNGLLLFWGTGVGKTCASIQICENHLKSHKEHNKRILVIAAKNTISNFKKELFNTKKDQMEQREKLLPGALQCTGNRYFLPYDHVSRDEAKDALIQEDYEFVYYTSLKGLVQKILQDCCRMSRAEFMNLMKMDTLDDKQKKDKEQACRGIGNFFSDRLIVIDEIQNIRDEDTPKKKKSGGEEKEDEEGEEEGEEEEEEGEEEKDDKGDAGKKGKGPSSISAKTLEYIIMCSTNTKLVLLSATPMYNNATEIVYIINLLLKNDKKPPMVESEFFKTGTKGKLIEGKKKQFEEIVKGYISYVRGNNPITFPKQLFPENATKINDDSGDAYKFVKCNLSKEQKEIHQKEMNKKTNVFNVPGLMACFMVYPNGQNSSNKTFKDYFTKTQTHKYEYTKKKKQTTKTTNQPFFHTLDDLALYSPKIVSLMKSIKESEGIHFVWCHYKEGMAIPLALILSYYGLEPYEKHPGPSMDRAHDEFLKKDGKTRHKYVFLGTETNKEGQMETLLEACNNDANKNGDIIKVIIATSVAEEGVDFKNIRHIHALHPWYNMSRIDQIIGRGIRNCSHKLLAPEKQNVTVYLYCSTFSDETNGDTTDVKNYKSSLEKDKYIKQVELILKNAAVDCHSNIATNKNALYEDKDNDRECAYGACSEYKCNGGNLSTANTVNTTTYEPEVHAKTLINEYKHIVKKLFSIVFVLSLEDIEKIFGQEKPQYIKELLYIALSVLISQQELLYDKYDRLGALVYEDGYYYFHPNDLSQISPRLPGYYRKTPLTVKSLLAQIDVAPRQMASDDIKRIAKKNLTKFKNIIESVGQSLDEYEHKSLKEYNENVDEAERKKKSFGAYLLQHNEKKTFTRALIGYYMDRIDPSVLEFILFKCLMDKDGTDDTTIDESVKLLFKAYSKEKHEMVNEKHILNWSPLFWFELDLVEKTVKQTKTEVVVDESEDIPDIYGSLEVSDTAEKELKDAGFQGLQFKVHRPKKQDAVCKKSDMSHINTLLEQHPELKKYYNTKDPKMNVCKSLELLMRQLNLIRVRQKPKKAEKKSK